MTNHTNPNRRPAGTPAGGQFAPTGRAESSGRLDGDQPTSKGDAINMTPTVTAQDVRTVFVSVAGTHQAAVVWCPRDITCCPGQAGWPADQEPDVWDQTGQGDWDVSSYVQCGGCGSLIMPVSRVLLDPSDAELAQARILVAEEQSDRDAARRSRLIVWLRESLDELTRDQIRELPDLMGMPEPGVGLDTDGSVVAWDYDPAYPGDDSKIISERRRQ